jgi:flotillin
MASYKVAAPDEYLAITGMGIKSVRICKSAWVFPFQRCTRFSVHPHDYAMNLQAMTKEKLQFMLPVVFTVGPDVNSRGANTKSAGQRLLGSQEDHDDLSASHPGLNEETNPHAREDRGDALMKFAMLLADSSASTKKTNSQQFVENIVKGVIEGETRVLVSSMTMEEIFTEREVFKKRIYRNIQIELDQFGLKIYNANVKELKDAPNSGYFESLSRKAHEGATNQVSIAAPRLATLRVHHF